MPDTEPTARLVTPDEARRLMNAATPGPWEASGYDVVETQTPQHDVIAETDLRRGDARLMAIAPDLAHTVIVLSGQQQADKAAALAEHYDDGDGTCSTCARWSAAEVQPVPYPCPTARALGVTE